jgi:hypothetical protein
MPSRRAHAIEFVVNYEQLRSDRLCKIGPEKKFCAAGHQGGPRDAYRRAPTGPQFVGKKMGRRQSQFRRAGGDRAFGVP